MKSLTLGLLLLSGASLSAQPDEEITPAQYSVPQRVVADPAPPLVRIQVRVPANVAPNQPIAYKLIITNVSQADAYGVSVRNIVGADIAEVVKAEPKYDAAPLKPGSTLPSELVWEIGTLRGGDKREIDLELRPKVDAKAIRNQAFVTFEHGEVVTTKIDVPRLEVRKFAPKEALSNGMIPVRVEVRNSCRVPIAEVKLVETVSKGFDFAEGSRGTKGTSDEQRIWTIGTLQPGEGRLVTYQLKPTAEAKDELLAISVAQSKDVAEADKTESTTKILVPDIALTLTGPATATAGETVQYELVARNTGTVPLSGVQIAGSIPRDCELTKMTYPGQHYRDTVQWQIDELRPGDAQSFRLSVRSIDSGTKTVKARVQSRLNVSESKEVSTDFNGVAVLHISAEPSPAVVREKDNGLLTVRVTNHGSDTANNVRLDVELPKEVGLVRATPGHQAAADRVVFNLVSIPPNRTETFSLTYDARQTGQAMFRLKLGADSLGSKPLLKEQSVEIVR